MSGERGRPRDEAIGEAAIEAALGLLVENGAAAVTVDAVARRIGSTRTAIYRRWPNAGDLLRTAMDHTLMHAARRSHLDPPYSAEGLDLLSTLKQIMWRLVQIAGEPRFAASYLALAAATRNDSSSRPVLDGYLESFSGRIISILQGTDKSLSKAVAVATADLMVGVIFHQAIMLSSCLDQSYTDTMAEVLCRGIRQSYPPLDGN